MINPMQLLQMKPLIESFKNNHPKFINFVQAVVGIGLKEDTIVEITVTSPEGQSYNANIKLNKDDIELLMKIKDMM